MLRFAVRRLASMALVLLAISVFTFLVFNVIPNGDPALRIAGRNANPELREQIRRDYGFDRPLYVQYWRLMRKTATGDLVSYSNQTNVREEIVRGIPATASLVVGAGIIWLLFGVAFGVLAAVHAGRPLDRALTIFSLVGISMPVFWVGAMLLYYLTYRVELFPSGGYAGIAENPLSWLSHMILPWFALSILFIGFYSRLLRSNILDEIGEDYVRTARAKGLSERRVLVRHVLRNALIPIVTVFGLDFGYAIGGGAVLTESVFDLQGVGQYVADSTLGLDLPPLMGVVLYGAFFIVLFNALVDIVYAYLDPRIRLNP